MVSPGWYPWGAMCLAVPTTSTSSPSTAETPLAAFRTPASARYLSLFAFVFIGLITLLALGFAAALIFSGEWGFGAFIAALGIFMGALDGYVLRDLLGRWDLRAELFKDRVVLNLPAERSLIHRPPGQRLTIPYNDIEAIETRLEAYPSFLMETLQCPYVLVLKQGNPIFLFEDRALATPMQTTMYGQIAAAIAEHAHVPIRDLGMVEGKGGFLAVWGTHAPDWAAPSLPLAQRMRILRHVAWTGFLATSLFMLALLINAAFG